jgi:hypothetical protein
MEISICELIWSTVGKETDFAILRTGQNAQSLKSKVKELLLSERRPDLAKEGKDPISTQFYIHFKSFHLYG